MGESKANPLFSTGSIIDDKWILMERIGKGGMGEVYRAHQLNLKRDVAIKIISRELMEAFQDDPDEARRAFQRLQREVQTMAQVRHPNALQIFDFGEIEAPAEGGRTPMQYIVMEYVPGNTLRFTMSEEGFGEDDDLIREWLRQYFFPVLDGMEAVHAKGVVHRDVKPENVLMDGDIPKIADFGLARSVQMRAISNSWDVKGTMHYMAPEQFIDFRKVGPQADVYALGKILYEAVEGKIGPGLVPLKSVNLGNVDGPFFKELDRIVRKATAESADERYPSIPELRSALEEAIGGLDRREKETGTAAARSRGRRWMAALAVLALASVLAMAVWHIADRPVDTRLPAVETPAASSTEAPDAEFRGRDGKAMVLIEGGLPEGKLAAPFYMDREKVTYYQYVEFLNEFKERLSVKEGAVSDSNGDVWLYLGTGAEPHEQIFHEHDRFHLRDSDFAGQPVVQVTFYGARAYARYYSKELPTESQWKQALSWLMTQLPESALQPGISAESADDSPPGHMHMMDAAQNHDAPAVEGRSPDTDLPLADPAMHVREWTARGGTEGESRSMVVSWNSLTGGEHPKARYMSEGFSDVGFRTVLSLKRKKIGKENGNDPG